MSFTADPPPRAEFNKHLPPQFEPKAVSYSPTTSYTNSTKKTERNLTNELSHLRRTTSSSGSPTRLPPSKPRNDSSSKRRSPFKSNVRSPQRSSHQPTTAPTVSNSLTVKATSTIKHRNSKTHTTPTPINCERRKKTKRSNSCETSRGLRGRLNS